MSSERKRSSSPESVDRKRRLRDPVVLQRARIRDKFGSKAPEFRHVADEQDPAFRQLVCNGCNRGIHIDTALPPAERNEMLQNCIFMDTFRDIGWKTYLCEECTDRATRLYYQSKTNDLLDWCVNCATITNVVAHESTVASAKNRDEPRYIRLCDCCTRLCAAQLERHRSSGIRKLTDVYLLTCLFRVKTANQNGVNNDTKAQPRSRRHVPKVSSRTLCSPCRCRVRVSATDCIMWTATTR